MVSEATYSQLCAIKEWLLAIPPGERRTFTHPLWSDPTYANQPIEVWRGGGWREEGTDRFIIDDVPRGAGVNYRPWRTVDATACGILFLLNKG